MITIYKNNEIDAFLERFESRRTDVSEKVVQSVNEILSNVRKNGDQAVAEYAKRFDQTDLFEIGFKVDKKELQHAHQNLDNSLIDVIRQSRDNIRSFHEKGLPQSWLSWEQDNVILGQRVIPLNRVGVYVPGGTAAYPSSLLMGAVPAQVAGVKEIIIVTPSDKQGKVNPVILATAYELGIDTVFRVGGAHAVAALAFGTRYIPRVDKIVGPGNIYVATAKKMLYGTVGIDMVAGPSEVVVIADDSAHAGFVAADLLAQAEHDILASSILVTPSESFALAVAREVKEQTSSLPRASIVSQSLENYGGIIVLDDIPACIDVCNRLAPEHLGLHVDDPWNWLGHLSTSGAIFLGSYSPEAVGDYWAGPNHVLPTNGSGRFFSPLRTEDFIKTSSIISFSQQAMQKHGEKIIRFANAEGLQAHASAIQRRIENNA
jgi:histidinol dehydrogenase